MKPLLLLSVLFFLLVSSADASSTSISKSTVIIKGIGGISVYVYYYNGTDEIALEDVDVQLLKLPDMWTRRTNVFGNVFFDAEKLGLVGGNYTVQIREVPEYLNKTVAKPETQMAYWTQGKHVMIFFKFEAISRERETQQALIILIMVSVGLMLVVVASLRHERVKKLISIYLIGKKAKK